MAINMESRKAPEPDPEEEKAHELLMQDLKKTDSISEQMEILYERLRLTKQDLHDRKTVCQHVQRVLRSRFPSCTVHEYGSFATGLGMPDSDLDLFVDLHDDDEQSSLDWTATAQRTRGQLSPKDIREMSSKDPMTIIHHTLSRSDYFDDVITIPSKLHPIVRFCHVDAGVSCDLSIRNPAVLKNTELLRLCASDERIKLLLFTVRYWAKRKQLLNTRDVTHKLSSYCLSMLVLHYLSAPEGPQILPTVAELVEMASKREVVGEWDCSLPDKLPPTENEDATVEDLLKGFFRYIIFTKKILKNYVIITHSAEVMKRELFVWVGYDNAVKDFGSDRAMAVSDPLIQDRNIAIGVNKPVRDLFASAVEEAAKKLSRKSLLGPKPSLVDILGVDSPEAFVVRESAAIELEHQRRRVKLVSPYFLVAALLFLAVSPYPKSGLDGILAYLVFCLCANYVQRRILNHILKTFSLMGIVKLAFWFVMYSLAYKFFEPFLKGAAPELVGISLIVVYSSFAVDLIVRLGRGLKNLLM